MTVKQAFQEIVNHRNEPSLNWAVNYAEVGLYMEDGSEEQRVQCLYTVGNISRWRGPLAKEVRETLKKGGKYVYGKK